MNNFEIGEEVWCLPEVSTAKWPLAYPFRKGKVIEHNKQVVSVKFEGIGVFEESFFHESQIYREKNKAIDVLIECLKKMRD